MPNLLLTAKKDIKSPTRTFGYDSPKDLKKGYTIITVANPSTQDYGIQNKDLVGALLLAGFCKEEAEYYADSSWTNNFDGVVNGELDHELASQQFQAQLHREDYSARKKWEKQRAALKESSSNESHQESGSSNSSSSNSSNDEEGYCKKLMLTVLPVLPIWWIIKLPFSIIAYPFRKLSSSSKDATLFPHYSLNKF